MQLKNKVGPTGKAGLTGTLISVATLSIFAYFWSLYSRALMLNSDGSFSDIFRILYFLGLLRFDSK